MTWRRTGRTEDMLRQAVECDSEYVIIVAHSYDYAQDLCNSLWKMLEDHVVDPGVFYKLAKRSKFEVVVGRRKFKFISSRTYDDVRQRTRGRGIECPIFYDHHFHEVLRSHG